MLKKRIPAAMFLAATLTAGGIAVGYHLITQKPAPSVAQQSSAPVASPGSLQMRASLSHSAVARAGSTVYARIQLQGDEVVAGTRPPLDVALVVDCSGSMGGEKMEQAKAAAHELLSKMGEDDRIGIVKFDGIVFEETKLFEVGQERNWLSGQIDTLRPRGATNIAAGYSAGLKMLSGESSADRTRVMFLLSDGVPTAGTMEPKELSGLAATGLQRHGVTVTTLGVGDDFDENILGPMATLGGGHFYYVETPESLRRHLNAEWEGLSTAAARNVSLQLTPAAGVRVAEAYGFGTSVEGGATLVYLDTIFSNRQRDVLVRLEASDQFRGGEFLDVQLHYDDVTSDSPTAATARATLHVEAVSRAIAEGDVAHDVLARAQQVHSATVADKADRLWGSGRAEEGGRLLQELIAENERFAKTYGASKELEKSQVLLHEVRDQIANRGNIQEKRQIRIRKKRKKDTIHIISGDK